MKNMFSLVCAVVDAAKYSNIFFKKATVWFPPNLDEQLTKYIQNNEWDKAIRRAKDLGVVHQINWVPFVIGSMREGKISSDEASRILRVLLY